MALNKWYTFHTTACTEKQYSTRKEPLRARRDKRGGRDPDRDADARPDRAPGIACQAWRDFIGPSPLTQCAPTPQPPSAPWEFVGSKHDRLKDGCNKRGAYSASLIEKRRTTQGQLRNRDKVCRRAGERNRVRSRIHVASGISFRISRSSPRWSLDVNCHFETHLWRRCGARHATCTVCACCTRPGQAARTACARPGKMRRLCMHLSPHHWPKHGSTRAFNGCSLLSLVLHRLFLQRGQLLEVEEHADDHLAHEEVLEVRVRHTWPAVAQRK